jgi:hypothetical protein
MGGRDCSPDDRVGKHRPVVYAITDGTWYPATPLTHLSVIGLALIVRLGSVISLHDRPSMVSLVQVNNSAAPE